MRSKGRQTVLVAGRPIQGLTGPLVSRLGHRLLVVACGLGSIMSMSTIAYWTYLVGSSTDLSIFRMSYFLFFYAHSLNYNHVFLNLTKDKI